MMLRSSIFFCEVAVNFPIAPDGGERMFVRRFFNFCRNAHHDRIRRYHLPLHDDGARRNEAIFPDFRAVEDRGVHPDDAILANRRAVNDRVVPDGDIFFNERGKTEVHMNHGVVLNVAISADRDRRHVAAQNRTEPDARVFSDGDVADDGSGIGNEHGIVDLGLAALAEPKRVENVFQRILKKNQNRRDR